MVSLRFLELIALLLPVLAIVVQALFANYSRDPADRSSLVQLAVLSFGLALLFLMTVAINLVGYLQAITKAGPIDGTFDTLVIALFLTLVAMLATLTDFYRSPTDGSDTTTDAERSSITPPPSDANRPNTTDSKDETRGDTDGE